MLREAPTWVQMAVVGSYQTRSLPDSEFETEAGLTRFFASLGYHSHDNHDNHDHDSHNNSSHPHGTTDNGERIQPISVYGWTDSAEDRTP